MEELCGFEVSLGQVSNLNKQLDEEFAKWRARALPEIRCLGASPAKVGQPISEESALTR
jgi:hypothetical protein